MITTTLKSAVDEDICLHLQPVNHKGSYICECGAASGLTVKECRDAWAIFISHAHIDHFCNFDGIFRHQLAVGRRVVVCGPPGIAQQVHRKLAAYTWNLSFDEQAVYYEVREIEAAGQVQLYTLRVPTWEPIPSGRLEGEAIYEDAGVRVRYALLDHGTPTVAWLFEEPSRLKIEGFPYRPGPWIAALKAAWQRG